MESNAVSKGLDYELSRAFLYFSTLTQCNEKIEEINKKIEECNETFRFKRKEIPISTRLFLCLDVILIFIGIIVFMTLFIDKNPNLALTLIFLSFLIIPITLIDSHNKKKKRALKYWNSEGGVLVANYQSQIAEIQEKCDLFMNENAELVQFVPEEYRNIQAVAYMLKCTKNGRADSLKEAMNLYEEALHRWKMEEAAIASLERQQALYEAQCDAEQRLAGIEIASAANAIFSILGAISRY